MKLPAYEFGFSRLTPLRECPLPAQLADCDHPPKAAAYFRRHVVRHPYYNPDAECFVVLLLNARRRPLGHHLVALGQVDAVDVHPREVFRPAIHAAAQAIICMHNHPSGNPSPSEADIRITRDLVQAGCLLKIEVLDHIILGSGRNFVSLKSLGYIS